MTTRWEACKNCPGEDRAKCDWRSAERRKEEGAGCHKLVVENSALHVQLVDHAQQRLQFGTDPEEVEHWLCQELTSLAHDDAQRWRYEHGKEPSSGASELAKQWCRSAAHGIVSNILNCTNHGERCSRCRFPGCTRKWPKEDQ